MKTQILYKKDHRFLISNILGAAFALSLVFSVPTFFSVFLSDSLSNSDLVSFAIMSIFSMFLLFSSVLMRRLSKRDRNRDLNIGIISRSLDVDTIEIGKDSVRVYLFSPAKKSKVLKMINDLNSSSENYEYKNTKHNSRYLEIVAERRE